MYCLHKLLKSCLHMYCCAYCLQDNLESGTYEVFEKDTIKYVQYEEAVYRALMDRGGAQVRQYDSIAR